MSITPSFVFKFTYSIVAIIIAILCGIVIHQGVTTAARRDFLNDQVGELLNKRDAESMSQFNARMEKTTLLSIKSAELDKCHFLKPEDRYSLWAIIGICGLFVTLSLLRFALK